MSLNSEERTEEELWGSETQTVTEATTGELVLIDRAQGEQSRGP